MLRRRGETEYTKRVAAIDPFIVQRKNNFLPIPALVLLHVLSSLTGKND